MNDDRNFAANGEHWEEQAIRRQADERCSPRRGMPLPYPAWLQAELEAMDREPPRVRRGI